MSHPGSGLKLSTDKPTFRPAAKANKEGHGGCSLSCGWRGGRSANPARRTLLLCLKDVLSVCGVKNKNEVSTSDALISLVILRKSSEHTGPGPALRPSSPGAPGTIVFRSDLCGTKKSSNETLTTLYEVCSTTRQKRPDLDPVWWFVFAAYIFSTHAIYSKHNIATRHRFDKRLGHCLSWGLLQKSTK